MNRRSYEDALAECGVLEALASFDPRVAGTPPLGLDLPDSDIDVLCFAPKVGGRYVPRGRGPSRKLKETTAKAA